MKFNLQKPILLGGLGLTATVWLLEALHPISAHGFGGAAIWSAIALGSGAWFFWQQKRPMVALDFLSNPPDRAAVDQELANVNALIDQLVSEFPAEPGEQQNSLIEHLRHRRSNVIADLERKQARLAIVGGTAVGKSTLAQLLSGKGEEPQSDGLDGLEAADSDRVQNADLVLFITAGDLTDPEFQTIDRLLKRQQRLVLIFNKQDQYLPDERPLILNQLRERVAGRLPEEDVVAISAQPMPLKVRQYQEDGSTVETLEQPAPDLVALQTRLSALLTQQGTQLILTTAMRQALALKASVRAELNHLRRDRALPVIEQSQWIAAGAAFANPVPSLDLVSTAAVNAQMVVDLAAIYQQTLSLDWAREIAVRLGEVMVKLGIVEVTSQTIAPLLKSHALTYVAGGLMQGISAAYLTRIAGLALVEYLEEYGQSLSTESTFSLDRLSDKLKAVFQDNQRTAFLQTLVAQAIGRFAPTVPATAAGQ